MAVIPWFVSPLLSTHPVLSIPACFHFFCASFCRDLQQHALHCSNIPTTWAMTHTTSDLVRSLFGNSDPQLGWDEIVTKVRMHPTADSGKHSNVFSRLGILCRHGRMVSFPSASNNRVHAIIPRLIFSRLVLFGPKSLVQSAKTVVMGSSSGNGSTTPSTGSTTTRSARRRATHGCGISECTTASLPSWRPPSTSRACDLLLSLDTFQKIGRAIQRKLACVFWSILARLKSILGMSFGLLI
jgi:hypothetical protein